MAERLKEVASVEKQPSMEGRRMHMVLTLLAGQKAKAKEGMKEA